MEALRTLYVGMPLDLGIALALFAALLAYNSTLGKNRAVSLLTALYIAGAVAMLAPAIGFLDSVLPLDPRFLPVGVFALLAAITYGVIVRSSFFDPYIVPSGWELGLFSFLHAIVIIVVVVSLLPASVTDGFSANFARVFMDPTIRSVLIVIPLAVLAVLRGK
ncbi:hypothetical protein HYS28_00955 [Candidatus Uhrbacteria bacterium]|nr:hypothetical protein [Candidatus Uhrbacteria bacterium]